MSHVNDYLNEAANILQQVDRTQIEKTINFLLEIREKAGRLFLLGVGGSAGNCSHAVNDFRKLAGIEAYAPTDNISELTARINDEGWQTVFSEWLRTSQLSERDGVFVLSVGGGNKESNISANIVHALELAQERKAKILGIVGRDGGYTAKVAHACIKIPVVNPNRVTPHSEAFQAVVWHLIVSDPRIKLVENKWESTK